MQSYGGSGYGVMGGGGGGGGVVQSGGWGQRSPRRSPVMGGRERGSGRPDGDGGGGGAMQSEWGGSYSAQQVVYGMYMYMACWNVSSLLKCVQYVCVCVYM